MIIFPISRGQNATPPGGFKLYPAKLVTKLLASDGGATASTNGGVAASSNGSAAASSDGEDGQGVEIDPSEVMEQY